MFLLDKTRKRITINQTFGDYTRNGLAAILEEVQTWRDSPGQYDIATVTVQTLSATLSPSTVVGPNCHLVIALS